MSIGATILQAIKAAEEHITAVTKEHSHYPNICIKSKKNMHELYTSTMGSFEPPPPHSAIRPLSNDTTIHYSFDMAQQVFITTTLHTYKIPQYQVHYPSDPMQPGPMYFLTPRKCAIFGVCCEAVPRQVKILILCIHNYAYTFSITKHCIFNRSTT